LTKEFIKGVQDVTSGGADVNDIVFADIRAKSLTCSHTSSRRFSQQLYFDVSGISLGIVTTNDVSRTDVGTGTECAGVHSTTVRRRTRGSRGNRSSGGFWSVGR
jgi:hypothetical protein